MPKPRRRKKLPIARVNARTLAIPVVMEMINEYGHSKAKLSQFIRDVAYKFGIAERTARSYIEEARVEIYILQGINKQDLKADIALTMLKIKDGVLTSNRDRISAARVLNKMYGLNEPDKVEISGNMEAPLIIEAVQRELLNNDEAWAAACKLDELVGQGPIIVLDPQEKAPSSERRDQPEAVEDKSHEPEPAPAISDASGPGTDGHEGPVPDHPASPPDAGLRQEDPQPAR